MRVGPLLRGLVPFREARVRGGTEALGERPVGEDAHERCSQPLHVVDVDQQALPAVLDQVEDPAGRWSRPRRGRGANASITTRPRPS